MTAKLEKGKLYAYSGYLGKIYPGIFVKDTGNSYQFIDISQRTLTALQEKRKPYVSYITGNNVEYRVVEIDPSVLDKGEQEIYNLIKQF